MQKVVVAGGGLVGLALAASLAQSRVVAVQVIASSVVRGEEDVRCFALTPASRQFLDGIGVWERVASKVQPVERMVISDSAVDDVVRVPVLQFDDGIGPVAFMIASHVLHRALHERVGELEIVCRDARIERIVPEDARTRAVLGGGQEIEAALVVAADGAGSLLREDAGIGVVGWPYGQSAISAVIHHTLPHEGVAYQHFFPEGPFACLPLTGPRSSLVWSLRHRQAQAMMALGEDRFVSEITLRLGQVVGDVTGVGRRQCYPLRLQLARSFIAPRLALVGDAAHVIHPLAGQGFNLGLGDVTALSRTVQDAALLGLDVGQADVLASYQSERRPACLAMAAGMDALNRVFSANSDMLRMIRGVGVGAVERHSRLKEFFMRRAAGIG